MPNAASATVTTDPHSHRSLGGWRPGQRTSLYLLASIVLAFLAASSVPTPLYAVYQSEWHFTPITTTVVFGIYALAVLSALLVLGRLSDHVGRRPILLGAIAAQAVTTVIFSSAGDVGDLVIARIIQGFATGAAVGAVGAGMLDLDRVKGTLLNAAAPITGTATGGLLAGILVQYAPWRTHLVYLVLLAIFAVQAVGVALMAEPGVPEKGALASLRPEIHLPTATRAPLLVAGPVFIAVWAVGGLYGSLGPSLVADISGSSSLVLGGLALFVLAGSGALTVVALRNVAPRRVMTIGISALILGTAITIAAVADRSTVTFFFGSVIAGIGFGGGFQGGIKTVVPTALPDERAGVLSVVYIISYLALGLPAVGAGILVVHGGGLIHTAEEYGAAVIALALVALVGLFASARRQAAALVNAAPAIEVPAIEVPVIEVPVSSNVRTVPALAESSSSPVTRRVPANVA